MTIDLPSLPYAFDALEPCIDERTLRDHYLRYHRHFIDDLEAVRGECPGLENASNADLLLLSTEIPPSIRHRIRHSAGGHLNHLLLWESLAPPTSSGCDGPSGALGTAITMTFGGIAAFKREFMEQAFAALGPGWVWFCLDPTGRLVVQGFAAEECPLWSGYQPLLGLDLWEHAYALRYGHRLQEYITAWWHVVYWPHVAERLVAANRAFVHQAAVPV